MDLIGWFLLGILGAAILSATLWGRATDRKRAAAARAWASAAGLSELPFGQEGVPSDLAVRRLRSVPSFVGTLDGRKVSVLASSTKPRLGDLWALCTHAPRPPLFLGNIFGFSAANVFGQGAPRGWVRVKAGPELDRLFFASVPEDVLAPTLSDEARAALLEADVHAWCWSVSPGGFTVVWFKQTYGQDTGEALTQAAQLLRRVLA